MCSARAPIAQPLRTEAEVKLTVVGCFVVLCSATLIAQQPQCTASVTPTIIGDAFHVVATAGGGETPTDPSCSQTTGVDAFIGGNLITGTAVQCSGASCSSSGDVDTRCMARGLHTFTAHGSCSTKNCGTISTTSDPQTLTLDRPNPTVSVTYAKATALGEYTLTAAYSFPNTTSGGREILIYDPAGGLVGGCGGLSMPNPSGSCEAGTFDPGCGGTFTIVATSCNDLGTRTVSTFVMPETWYLPSRFGCGTTDPLPVPPTPPDCPDCGPTVGEPINTGSGDVYVQLPLFSISELTSPLAFTLTYHSARHRYPTLANETGIGWSHSFGAVIRAIDASADHLVHVSETGTESIYTRDATNTTTWNASQPATTFRILQQVGSQYRLTDLNGTVQAFDVTTGRWLSTTDRWGNQTTAQYDANGLASVTDPLGRVTSADHIAGRRALAIHVHERQPYGNPRSYSHDHELENVYLRGESDRRAAPADEHGR